MTATPDPESVRTEFEFIDIPAGYDKRDRRNRVFFDFAVALRNRPGEWAKWPVPVAHPRPVASGINNHNGKCPKALLDAGFEACIYGGELCVRYKNDYQRA